MPWKRHVLVVANVTAASQELLSALRERAEREPTAIHLIVPAAVGGGRAAAYRTLEDALTRLRHGGFEADGLVGDADPVGAVTDVWDPKRHDEIIVSTLPIGVSKWLPAGLPQRIERLTGAPVTHVVCQPPGQGPQATPAPAHEDRGPLMGPLSVLGWGSAQRQSPRLAQRVGGSPERPQTSS